MLSESYEGQSVCRPPEVLPGVFSRAAKRRPLLPRSWRCCADARYHVNGLQLCRNVTVALTFSLSSRRMASASLARKVSCLPATSGALWHDTLYRFKRHRHVGRQTLSWRCLAYAKLRFSQARMDCCWMCASGLTRTASKSRGSRVSVCLVQSSRQVLLASA